MCCLKRNMENKQMLVIYSKKMMGKLIMETRKKSGMSQRELAKAIDFHHSRISRWESGKSSPGESAILAMRDKIDLPVEICEDIHE